MKYTSFITLCKMINDALGNKIEIVYHAGGHHTGIKMISRKFPISINESEFNHIFNFIVDNGLKNGFELSTGTGISTIAIGSALKETRGHLITLDSYYEELTGISENIPVGSYTPEQIAKVKERSDCYKFVNDIVQLLELDSVVQVEIGWSPGDSTASIQKRGTLLDFVFLDCPKDDEEFERDIRSLKPYINMDKFAIFVHDTHTYNQKSFDLIKEIFGTEMVQIHEYFKDTEHYTKQYYPLAIITNIKT